MTNLPQLPDMIDPEARHVEFRATQCAECREAGPVVQAENPEWFEWMTRHRAETGHEEIYQWTLSRSRGKHTTLRTEARSRRTLGKRGQ